ncbi:hypothetical protein B7494_g3343 [Chlorociboria aeruginascens]|nr:hypothetical protein B7494_g3343 [Chlorociboria aeruginascens]
MSLPSSGYGTIRQGSSSAASHSSPRYIPGSSESQDGASATTSDLNYGSFRGQNDPANPAYHISTVHGQREPTRSFVQLSYRGHLSTKSPEKHICHPNMSTAPVDSSQYARSVREDTVELASYALSDKASLPSSSPSRHQNSQFHLESFFSQPDSDPISNRESEGIRHEIIEEVSEPVSPEAGHSPNKSPGTSAIANALRYSPPNASPATEEEDNNEEETYNNEDEVDSTQGRLIITSNGVEVDVSERTPLVAKNATIESSHPDWISGQRDVESHESKRRASWSRLRSIISWPAERGLDIAHITFHPKRWDRKTIWNEAVVAPIGYLPAVVLGLLLNVLDALSYGGSAFKGGIGSEMIEVVPFFHKMAFTIMKTVGEDNPEAVIATTITSYAISSILTGIVFFLMGTCGFGYIVGFIPRHILIGCIGGVGWFLVATGFEVTARLDGNLNYNGDTLRKMFEADTVALWTIPFALAIFLYWSEQKVHSKYYLSGFILSIPAIFYFFVFSLDELDTSNLRKKGWIFEGPEADFKLVHWDAIAETIPAMFALTFFGILHVPINVPALAINVGEDNLNLDRELIAHGFSNALSGFAGSIQNYLVYTNSTIFIRSGGNSRLAGAMLAVATFGVMLVGPALIGYIPVMMVGILIFVLGIELLIDAVWEPRKKLKMLEYLTVVAIVLVMGIYDFVIGIFVGIGLAFVSLVVQTSRIPAVRASYSGEIAGSTVRRNPMQYQFLRDVGQQIHITKLAGYLFFGTIVSVEERIRALIEDEAFHKRPIRFLIFDFWHVSGIDYSAAEAFNRLNRIFNRKGVTLVMSGVNADGPLGTSMSAVGLGQDGNEVRLFGDLNSALESCENELLKTFYTSREARTIRNAPTSHLDVPLRGRALSHALAFDTQFSSPRRTLLHRAATNTLDEDPADSKYSNFKEPLRLILQTFHGLTDKNEDFWFPVVQFFVKKEYMAGTVLYHRGEQARGFYIVERGILRADYELPQGRYFESIVAGTTCGELPFFSETDRTATVQVERDCVVWLMDREKWDELQTVDSGVAQEMLRISLKLTSERMSAITSYVLTTAG